MGLLSFLQRGQDEARRDGPAASALPADAAQQARVRARRRLIGASLLLGLGVVGFPLLFETQPRPVPVDIPIEIPAKDSVPPLPLPPKRASAPTARATPAPVAEVPAEAGRDPVVATAGSAAAAAANSAVPPAPASAARPKPESKPEPKPEAKPEPKPEVKPEPKPQPKPEPKASASADAKPPVSAAAASDAGRFVVQVGAFADAGGAREARQKVEKLGLKTYTQEVDVAGAKRIRVRVGPFASRDEAAKVVARLKAGGLPGALLTL